jgi:manganese/iron transport system substrate-binding protein
MAQHSYSGHHHHNSWSEVMKRLTRSALAVLTTALLFVLAASGCQSAKEVPGQVDSLHSDEMPVLSAVPLDPGTKLRVVATTTIVADVVQQIGGEQIDFKTLLPPGTDPHTFEPTPQDFAAVADAHVVFINGAGLELFLEPLLENAEENLKIVPVSYGLELFRLADSLGHAQEEDQGESDDHAEGGVDPHTWFDPYNVIGWTNNIEQALSALDPAHADAYKANAQAYERQLRELDLWIGEQLAQVAESDRRLVTDHATFGYFARRYGFQQVGAVFPGLSTLDEPSARERAALENTIQELEVRALFVSTTVNPDLADQIAQDTGVKLVRLYAGSLSEPGGPADSYLSLMRYDVSAIVKALSNP